VTVTTLFVDGGTNLYPAFRANGCRTPRGYRPIEDYALIGDCTARRSWRATAASTGRWLVGCWVNGKKIKVVVSPQNSQMAAGFLRISLCSAVLGGAQCNGCHAKFINIINAQF
jgi:hypothetical protein